MKVSDKVIVMIKHHEGIRRSAYLCPAKLWTIGVGHVLYPAQAKLPLAERASYPIDPIDRGPITDAEIDHYLAQDLARFERGVARYCPSAIDNQGQFDALVSFSFNVGLGNLQRSSLRMKHNRGDYEGAAEEFMKWTKGGGRILPGLVKRRRDEQALYLSELPTA
jgi:lysozyme